MKTKIIIFFLIISSLSYSQEKDSIKLKELEFAEKITYHLSSDIFNKQEINSKIDKKYKLPWDTKLYTEEESKTALDTLIKNATFKIKKGSFSNHILEFNSYFPEFIDDALMDIFKLSIKKSDIDNKGTNLDIQETGSFGFGSHSSSGYENGNTYSHHWRTLNATFNIKTKIKTEEYRGSILFESGFVKGYDYLKITNSDVGKEMKIGNYEFTVIDIIDNSVILDFKTNIEDLVFTLVNLNKKGQRITSSEGMFSSQTLFKDIYLKFKENPKLSFEDYKKAFHSKFIEMIKNAKNKKETQENFFGKEYRVFSSPGNLINAYLYLPNYTSKTFEINYNKNIKERIPRAAKTSLLKKVVPHFENENEDAVLLGDKIKLLDKDLKLIKNIESGVFVKTMGKSIRDFKEDKYDETCEAYKYVKIKYEDEKYLVAGKNVFKMTKLDKQIPYHGTLEFLRAESSDYLKVFQPDGNMEFCSQITYSPIIIKSTKNDSYGLIDIVKDDLYSKITDKFKEADFFQSGSSAKIYDKITKIEITDNGFLLDLRHDGTSYNVSLTKKKNKYIAKYLNKKKISKNKRNGITKEFYKNGALKAEWNYKNNKLNGISKKFYRDGKYAVENYLNGKLIESKTFLKDGVLHEEFNIENGKRNGIATRFYKTGEKRATWEYKDNVLISGVTYYITGEKKNDYKYQEGKRNGISIGYFLDGKKRYEWNYIKGKLEGITIEYYKSGKKRYEWNYENNKLKGNSIKYYENGNVEKILSY